MKKLMITAALLMAASSANAGSKDKIEAPTINKLTELTNHMECFQGFDLEVSFYKKVTLKKYRFDPISKTVGDSASEQLACHKDEIDTGAFCIIVNCTKDIMRTE